MEKKQFLRENWAFYIMLENDVIEIFRYITLSKNNKNTYSVELQKLLLSIGSEFENQLKLYLEVTNGNIKNWQRRVVDENIFCNENTVKVEQSEDSWEIDVFGKWSSEINEKMQWWKDYNSIKHDRSDNFRKGNLLNVIEGLSSLYILLRYRYQKLEDTATDEIILPKSKLFTISWADSLFIADDYLF